MSNYKNDDKFVASDVTRRLIFMILGLFVAGAGFGGCVVCSVANGCSWIIGLPSMAVMFVGAVTFTLSTFNLLDGLESSEGDI